MTNRELNKACAEAVGFKVEFAKLKHNQMFYNEEKDHGIFVKDWNPCEDPVQNKMVKDWIMSLYREMEIFYCEAAVDMEGAPRKWVLVIPTILSVSGDTLELVICEAAAEALRIEKEGAA